MCPENQLFIHWGGFSSIVKLRRWFFLWVFIITGCASKTPELLETPALTSIPSPTFTTTPSPSPTEPILPSSTPTPMCTETSGHIEDMTYSGYVTHTDIPVRVYLPPCYKATKELYPILYVLHGYPMDETHWAVLGVVDVAENGFAKGSWGPFLIAMPRIPDPLNTRSDGGPGSYEEELLLGLIPAVENAYRVLGTRQDRAIAGVSRGGVWALEIGFSNADVFSTVVALSPALHVNNPRPAYNPFNLIQTQEQLPENIFLSAAEDEGGFRTKTEELSHLMDQLGITHRYLLTEGVHEDATWRGIMEDVVKFVTNSWEKSSQ
jgi:enterochelin esterase-like enzyme